MLLFMEPENQNVAVRALGSSSSRTVTVPPVHLQLKRKLRNAHMNMQEASSKYARRQQSDFIEDPHPAQFNPVNFIHHNTNLVA